MFFTVGNAFHCFIDYRGIMLVYRAFLLHMKFSVP